jgi:hypothetical protein
VRIVPISHSVPIEPRLGVAPAAGRHNRYNLQDRNGIEGIDFAREPPSSARISPDFPSLPVVEFARIQTGDRQVESLPG